MPARVAMAMFCAFLFHGPVAAADFANNYSGAYRALVSTMSTAVDGLGNEYSAGQFQGNTLVMGGETVTRVGAQDAFVAKGTQAAI